MCLAVLSWQSVYRRHLGCVSVLPHSHTAFQTFIFPPMLLFPLILLFFTFYPCKLLFLSVLLYACALSSSVALLWVGYFAGPPNENINIKPRTLRARTSMLFVRQIFSLRPSSLETKYPIKKPQAWRVATTAITCRPLVLTACAAGRGRHPCV